MPKKLNQSPVALVERAVLVACANARLPGWRRAQMKAFAKRLGEYDDEAVDLERECTRIVRSAGYRYARKLLNWLTVVQHRTDEPADSIAFPIGIPRQIPGCAEGELVFSAPRPTPNRRYPLRPGQAQVQHQRM